MGRFRAVDRGVLLREERYCKTLLGEGMRELAFPMLAVFKKPGLRPIAILLRVRLRARPLVQCARM
ncbi:hypothetical protein EMIT0P294_60247 [Pseudomonas sp. IT-P294]